MCKGINCEDMWEESLRSPYLSVNKKKKLFNKYPYLPITYVSIKRPMW